MALDLDINIRNIINKVDIIFIPDDMIYEMIYFMKIIH